MRSEADTLLLTSAEVADLFRVDTVTVTKWATDGKLVGFQTPGGHWRFRRADVDALLPEKVRAS